MNDDDKFDKDLDLHESEWVTGEKSKQTYSLFGGYIKDGYDVFAGIVVIGFMIWFFI